MSHFRKVCSSEVFVRASQWSSPLLSIRICLTHGDFFGQQWAPADGGRRTFFAFPFDLTNPPPGLRTSNGKAEKVSGLHHCCPSESAMPRAGQFFCPAMACRRLKVRNLTGLEECEGSCDKQTWLILPVVICLSQRLSHACLSLSFYTAKLRMAH